jgi:uncharacterized protein
MLKLIKEKLTFKKMDNKIKNYGAVAFLAILLVFAVSYLVYVKAYSDSSQPASYRSFSVTGTAKVVTVPDVIQFNFSVITEGGKDISLIQTQNTQKSNSIIDFLKAQGVEAKDIKTTNYSLDPRYQTYGCKFEVSSVCPPSEIVGYTVTQTVYVKVRDFSKSGTILSGAIEKGANSVSQLSYTIDDPTGLQSDARAKAIAAAIAKAELTAKAGGFRLGKLLSIDDGYYVPYSPNTISYDSSKTAAGALESVNIEPGSQEISANVTLRYEIK